MTQAYTYTKRIGNSRYIVKVSFDEKANDTFEDKLLRLIEQDAASQSEKQPYEKDDSNQSAG